MLSDEGRELLAVPELVAVQETGSDDAFEVLDELEVGRGEEVTVRRVRAAEGGEEELDKWVARFSFEFGEEARSRGIFEEREKLVHRLSDTVGVEWAFGW